MSAAGGTPGKGVRGPPSQDLLRDWREAREAPTAELWPSPSEPGQSQKLPGERGGPCSPGKGLKLHCRCLGPGGPGRVRPCGGGWAEGAAGCSPGGQGTCVSPRCAFSGTVSCSTTKHVRSVHTGHWLSQAGGASGAGLRHWPPS